MLPRSPNLSKPGLFVTATDTGVGKTVATCAIAWQLRMQTGKAVAVCKPYATGCRREREGLVSDDAEALAHFADCRLPLDVINPLRFSPPLAPAVAIEQTQQPADLNSLVRSLERLHEAGDFMLIEGVGGLLVPLDAARKSATVLDLIVALGYPVAVVCRAGLGTLNHTAMTCRLLRDAGCRVAGLIVNGYVPDPGEPLATAVKQAGAATTMSAAPASESPQAAMKPPRATTKAQRAAAKAKGPPPASLGADVDDLSMTSNPRWLARLTGAPVLATIPACPADAVQAHKGVIPDAVLDAVGLTYWADVLGEPGRG